MSANSLSCHVVPVLAAGILAVLTTSSLPPAQVSQGGDRHEPQIIEFDAPDACTASSPACASAGATQPYAVNDRGVIVGYYTNIDIVPHGFLRAPDGYLTPFEAPGAGLGYGLNEGTVALSINDRDMIAGQFQDSNYVFHGFVRHADGSFETFDAPGAGTNANQGTWGEATNSSRGEVAGYYIDANNAYHGFLRAPDGGITTFDAPGAGTNAYQGTVVGEKGINPDGEIDGRYIDENNVSHGFLRTRDGAITTFDPPGAHMTIAGGINPQGAITGYYAADRVYHGFFRARDGSFTIFDVPGAGTGSFQGTAAFSLNAQGAITGIYIDANRILHGFLRYPGGAFATFDAPGAGTSAGQGTRPEFVSADCVVVGFYYDDQGISHGFLRTADSRCESDSTADGDAYTAKEHQ